MKRLIMLVLILALIIPAGQAWSATAATTMKIKASYAPMHYVIDGKEFTPPSDQMGFIYTNEKNLAYTYVPLRFVASVLNKSVAWDPNTYKVTVSAPVSEDWKSIREYLDTQEVKNSNILPIDKTKISTTSITVSLTNVSYEFNGVLVKPNADTPGFLYKDRIYVPLRFMYESLGFSPAWDQTTYSITANTDPAQLEYQTIVKSNDKLIVDLKAACESELLSMGLQYLVKQKTMTEEEKAAFFIQAEQKLADCKVELQVLLDNLSEQLTEAGYPIDIIEQYLAAIEKREAEARALLATYQSQ
jgi:hypothetical protein